MHVLFNASALLEPLKKAVSQTNKGYIMNFFQQLLYEQATPGARTRTLPAPESVATKRIWSHTSLCLCNRSGPWLCTSF